MAAIEMTTKGGGEPTYEDGEQLVCDCGHVFDAENIDLVTFIDIGDPIWEREDAFDLDDYRVEAHECAECSCCQAEQGAIKIAAVAQYLCSVCLTSHGDDEGAAESCCS